MKFRGIRDNAERQFVMLVVSGGRLICLSTPYGKRGFFFKAWTKGYEWKRIEIPATSITRIAPAFLEEERRNLGESWFRQEYCCSFEAMAVPGLPRLQTLRRSRPVG
jgi:hypothetical protein